MDATAGKLNLIIGPMFSGKSTMLLTRYRRYGIAGKRCLLVKYAGDTRYNMSEESLVTHDKISYRATSCRLLAEISNIVTEYEVICIDEIQFYPDAHKYCDEWANNGLIVEACGLSGDFRREPFEQISRLIPICDDIQHVKAVCRSSGQDAPFSKRISAEQEQEVVGGLEKYLAVSRYYYLHAEGDKNQASQSSGLNT